VGNRDFIIDQGFQELPLPKLDFPKNGSLGWTQERC